MKTPIRAAEDYGPAADLIHLLPATLEGDVEMKDLFHLSTSPQVCLGGCNAQFSGALLRLLIVPMKEQSAQTIVS